MSARRFGWCVGVALIVFAMSTPLWLAVSFVFGSLVRIHR